MKKRRCLTLYLLYLLFVGLFVLPFIIKWFSGKVWLGWGYHNYLAPLLDQHNPPWYLWREQVGVATHPSFLDLLYYWPFNLLSVAVPSGYGAWLTYVYLVFALSAIFFAAYLRRLIPKISFSKSLLLGLFYTSYLSINQDGSFNLKLAAMVLPGLLYLLLVVYESFGQRVRNALNRKRSLQVLVLSIGGYLLSSLLIFNLGLLAPRGALALAFLVLIHLVVLWWRDRERQALFMSGGWFLSALVGAGVLFEPFRFARAAYLSNSVQISVPVQESVLTYLLKPATFVFHPYPGLQTPNLVVVMGALFVLGLILPVWKNSFKPRAKVSTPEDLKRLETSRLLFRLLSVLVVIYFLFLFRPFLSWLTLHFPYGQLFRTWRVAQFIAAFILPLLAVPLFVSSSRGVQVGLSLGVLVYVLMSVVSFSNGEVFLDRKNLKPYTQVNKFLAQDGGNHKVLWVPEMGWLSPRGEDTSPIWPKGESGQSFPEFMSSKPTYDHYYNQLTNFYTWLVSGYWRSWSQENPEVGHFLNLLGIKYLVVHDDVPAYQDNVRKMLKNLDQSSGLERVYQSEYLTVFENKEYQARVWANEQDKTVFCQNGYSCLGEFLRERSPYNFTVDLSDQQSKRVLESPLQVYQSRSVGEEEKYLDLLINRMLFRAEEKPSFVILFAKDFFKKQRFSACLSDTHHGLYHYYLDPEREYDYAENFVPGSCFFLLSSNQPNLRLPVELKPGKYKVLVRYLKHNQGGRFLITFPGLKWELQSRQEEGMNRYVYDTQELEIKNRRQSEMGLYGRQGINFIGLVAFIPEDFYQNQLVQLKSDFINVGEELVASANKASRSEVQQVKKVSPVLWEVGLNSQVPVVLNFAEAYHPSWQAEVWRGGKKVAVVESQPSYGVINSFPINQTGKLTVKIKYAVQAEFYQRFSKSLVIFGLVLLGLILLKVMTHAQVVSKTYSRP